MHCDRRSGVTHILLSRRTRCNALVRSLSGGAHEFLRSVSLGEGLVAGEIALLSETRE